MNICINYRVAIETYKRIIIGLFRIDIVLKSFEQVKPKIEKPLEKFHRLDNLNIDVIAFLFIIFTWF